MTVQLPIERTLIDMHRSAIDSVNRWRGHCVERYARLEHEVTMTLSAMAAAPGSAVRVPHNFGEKVKNLRAALCGDGHTKLTKALDSFEVHLSRRNMLVHASGKVWIDQKGGWLWHYRFQPSGKGKPMEIGCFEEQEARKFEHDLARESQRLGGQLRELRRKLESVTK
jgi:hypothetical protein